MANKIKLTAPGFRNIDPEILQEFIQCLNTASYYRAGEGSNYDEASARKELDRAANIAIENRFNFWMIDNLFNNTNPLAQRNEIVDRIFKSYYASLEK